MRDNRSGFATFVMSAALAAGALAAGGSTALAQAPEELTVTGHHLPNENPASFSYSVSYRDIDLRKKEGRDELDRRIRLTADYLCEKLEESDVHACSQQAVADANRQVRDAEDQAIAATTWVPGPPWAPPVEKGG